MYNVHKQFPRRLVYNVHKQFQVFVVVVVVETILHFIIMELYLYCSCVLDITVDNCRCYRYNCLVSAIIVVLFCNMFKSGQE